MIDLSPPVLLLTDTAPPLVWLTAFGVLLPLVTNVLNQLVFGKSPTHSDRTDNSEETPEVSILIPARDEENNIENVVRSALKCKGAQIEIIVLDDHSTDQTRSIVRSIAEEDNRVRLELAPDLPPGWCGKMHACARLAELAKYDRMLFVDADVTIAPEAPARVAYFMTEKKALLASAFPIQQTGTFLEKLLIPLIEYILLGYLPILAGRLFKLQGFGAGCGQVMMADRNAYFESGGHAAIKTTLHDGVNLPRAFRRAGFHTDICSGKDIVTCRMYHNAREVWSGLLKNAHEGVGSRGNIIPFTLLLIAGSLLPFLLLAGAIFQVGWLPIWAALTLILLSFIPRVINTIRFQQSWLGCLLHPLSIVLFLAIQWQSLIRKLLGKKPSWKGRQVG